MTQQPHPQQPKCIGFLGWMFGHKFETWSGSYFRPLTCYRCGYMP